MQQKAEGLQRIPFQEGRDFRFRASLPQISSITVAKQDFFVSQEENHRIKSSIYCSKLCSSLLFIQCVRDTMRHQPIPSVLPHNLIF